MPDKKLADPTVTVQDVRTTALLDWQERLFTAILLAVVVCCVFSESLFGHKAYYWGDIGLFFLPLNTFLKHSLSSGQIPLWNPYLYCGAPYVGNPQVSVVYPSTILLQQFPAPTAIMIAEAAHIFAAGVFFWIFARYGSLRLNYLPSLLAALVYMLCGFYVAKSQFPNMLAALTYVPLVLYAAERLVIETSLRSCVVYGVALGMQLLAAHTQIAVFTLYLVVAYGLYVFFQHSTPDRFWRTFALAVAGALIAVGLSCAYWLPTAELIHSSARQVLSLRVANRFYLPWNQLGNFVLPHMHGSPIRGDWRAHGNYWETDNYIGIVPSGLAIYGIWTGWKDTAKKIDVKFWSILLLVSTWLSLGYAGGVFAVAFFILPGLRLFHDPGRLMLGANVAGALFAGLGMQYVLARVRRVQVPVVAAAILLVASVDLGHHVRSIYPLKPVDAIQAMSGATVPHFLESRLSFPGSGRIIMPDSKKAWQSFTLYKTYEQNDPTYIAEWPDTVVPCLGMSDGVREVGGYDPEVHKESQELVSTAQNLVVPPGDKKIVALPPPPAGFSNYLAALGVEYLVAYRVNPIDASGLTPVLKPIWIRHQRQVTVYKNQNYVGRANVYSMWQPAADDGQAYNLLCQDLKPDTPNPSMNEPIVEGLTPDQSVPISMQQVTFNMDSPDKVELTTSFMKTPSVLVLRDTLFPGWHASIDGTPVRLLTANVDQRAVLLPPDLTGRPHDIAFVYRPTTFLFGLYVTCFSILLIISLLVGTYGRAGSLQAASRT